MEKVQLNGKGCWLIEQVTLVAITETTILVPNLYVQSMQLI